MKVTAMGLACMEKAVWAVYEGRFRPEEKVHQPWIDRNDMQALSGLGYLDRLAETAGRDGWLAGTAKMSQADITGVVAYSCTEALRPGLAIARTVPHLAGFAARCEAMDAFRAAPAPP